MEIDVVLSSRLNADEICALGKLAESVGIRGVWLNCLIDSHDPYTNMSKLATESSTLKLGPIAVNPFDTHPVRMCTSILTLNELAEGRGEIIVGGGGEALMALNIPPTKRVRAVGECVEILQQATAAEPIAYHGELYSVNRYHPVWATSPKPTIMVAANKPQMLRMASRVGDGIMMSDLPPVVASDAITTIKSHLVEFGRSSESFRFSNYMAWHVYDDKDKAIQEARMWLGYRGLFRRYIMTTFLSDDDYDIIEAHRTEIYDMVTKGTHSVPGVPERIMDALVENICLAGHTNEIDKQIEHLRRIQDTGMTEVALELHQDPATSIKLIGEKVVPALR